MKDKNASTTNLVSTTRCVTDLTTGIPDDIVNARQ